MNETEVFCKRTLRENIKVVCLTATPDDGFDDSLERDLMNSMKYKLVQTGKNEE